MSPVSGSLSAIELGVASPRTGRRATETDSELEPLAPSLSATDSVIVCDPSTRYDEVPVIVAPDAERVDGVVLPLPQSISAFHGASDPGSVKLPDTETASPERIDSGVVAASDTVGATLPMATACTELFSQPKASLTTSVAV